MYAHADRTHLQVFLAMEELDPGAETVAMTLIQAFQGRFRDIQNTLHPAWLPGEAQGKSSNISWAARRVGEKYSDGDNTIVTVMDGQSVHSCITLLLHM